jgi:putative choline sulfate-utilization transcription factor
MKDKPLDLGWLRIVDAVGRLGSLTRAARDLGMSQPAVTYQVRRIEEQLGVSLFHRSQGGSRPTEAGETLFGAVRSAVERIDRASEDIRRHARTPVVRILTDFGFAGFWLMPRVARLRDVETGVAVQIIASQYGLDLEPGRDFDAAVLFGARTDFPGHAQLLIPEKVVPVCTPGFLARFGPFATASDIATAPLLHLETVGEERWLSWPTWMDTQGVARPPSREDFGFNTYSFVIQAALAEQGIALGWAGLVDQHLEQGSLVAVGPVVERPERGYWLVHGEAINAATERLVTWLASAD